MWGGVVQAPNTWKFPLLLYSHGKEYSDLTDRYCYYMFIKKDAEDSGMSLLLSNFNHAHTDCGLLLCDAYHHGEVQR